MTSSSPQSHDNEMNAMHGLAQTLSHMVSSQNLQMERLITLGDTIARMGTDIAVMKEKDRQIGELRACMVDVEARTRKMEMLFSQQTGAGKFALMVKDFGPWAVAIIAVVWQINLPTP